MSISIDRRQYTADAGITARVVVDGGTEILHIPPMIYGRFVVVRVFPVSGQTITMHDSISPDADVLAAIQGLPSNAEWDTVQADSVSDGVFTVKTSITYMCPISGLKIAGSGVVEVLA